MVLSPKINFSTSSSLNESEYSPVGSIINTFLLAFINLSITDRLDVDFPLFVAPIANKCLSNSVSGYNFKSLFDIFTTLAN